MPPFTARPGALPGLLILESLRFDDPRGFFNETYREEDTRKAGIPPLVQDNISRSAKGTLRGLHYQMKPAAVGKLIRCTRGSIFDVVVDIRRGSPTFGKWTSIELTDKDNIMFWIPEGFAHGFVALTDVADVLYKVTGYYSPENDRGVLWSDPKIGIKWPGMDLSLSPKDANLPPLDQADNNFDWKP